MHTFLIIFGAKYLFLIAVIVFIIYLIRLPKDNRLGVLKFSLVNLFFVYITGLLAGYMYNNPRPFVVEHISPLIPHAANNGFPSDHTILVAALASILYCYNRQLGGTLFTIAFLVGASRVLAGIHHWVDIMGSFGIAIVVTFVVYKLFKKFRNF